MDSTNCAWCKLARFSQTVVEIEVPNAPAVMRAKLDKPEAAGMRSGVMPDRVMVTSGMKKNGMATPCTMVGTMMVAKSAWVLKLERIHSTSANTANAKVAKYRGSNLAMFLPTHGDSTRAMSPTGAITMPAWVAVYPMYCCSHSGNNTTLPKNRP